jgi:hypothetical protein
MLERDVVATWLNYLAGNEIGTDENPATPPTNRSPEYWPDQASDLD